MASHPDAAEESTNTVEYAKEPEDRIDDHLVAALESSTDDRARYHLREALQLKLADIHNS